MLNVKITRKWETELSVCGELTIVDNPFQCFTIEPSRTKPFYPGHPCIVAGTFVVKLTLSPHFGYVTPEVINVPGRTDIRWHIANQPKDLKGCAGLGSTHATDWVGYSGDTFKKLMAILNADADGIEVTYVEAVERLGY